MLVKTANTWLATSTRQAQLDRDHQDTSGIPPFPLISHIRLARISQDSIQQRE